MFVAGGEVISMPRAVAPFIRRRRNILRPLESIVPSIGVSCAVAGLVGERFCSWFVEGGTRGVIAKSAIVDNLLAGTHTGYAALSGMCNIGKLRPDFRADDAQ